MTTLPQLQALGQTEEGRTRLRMMLAELRGFKNEEAGGFRFWSNPDGSPTMRDNLPNFCEDLNACHEAEMTLTDDQYSQYAWSVLAGTPEKEVECREFFSACPLQRTIHLILALQPNQ
jgi:hypothetical protein